MRFIRSFAIAAAVAALAPLVAGCGKSRSLADGQAIYRGLASAAISLYGEIEPLRSSRLGITSSDSLLFTYSTEEIGAAVKRLKKLETRFSRFPASRLPERDIEEATAVIHWLRGESFSLESLKLHRSNPLLYCGIAREALWSIPSRPEPPAAGELDAYRTRIRRIPSLFANGGRHLRNPAEWHLRAAIESLDSLEATLDDCAALAEKRYGASLANDFEEVRISIRDFRRFASDVLLPVSHGKLILGSENLSKVLLYDEIINLDHNALVVEAEKRIIQCANEKSASLRRIEHEGETGAPGETAGSSRTAAPSRGEAFEARIVRLMDGLWAKEGARAPAVATEDARLSIRYPAAPGAGSRRGKSFAFSLFPRGDSASAAAVTAPFSAPVCRPSLYLSPGAAAENDDALRFALLCTAPRILEIDALRCRERDSIGTIFGSETFAEGWRYLALQELIQDLRKRDPALYIRMMDEQVRHYALMIAVFGLHAGTLTSEGAIRYLVETAGMTRVESEREILAVSVSPSRAYPAIAMILVEQMLKNLSYDDRGAARHGELARVLRESRDVPLSLIVSKTVSD